MQEYEYYKVAGIGGMSKEDLNRIGSKGWELVTVISGQAKIPSSAKFPDGQVVDTILGIFKRPVSRIVKPN